MCGIVAHLALKSAARISKEELSDLNNLLYHRGPDSGGSYLKGDIALAMRRLSIIDLASGDQPMLSDDERFVIVFNGEIYNHEEIKAELMAKGYRLKTHSDTEVLLYSYIDKREKCLDKLNGMFAFAIWDNLEQRLFLARDHVGIKPLYYAINEKRALFCSELKPFYQSGLFETKFNYQAISDYLAYWYICEPNTIFENIFQVPPGCYVTVQNGCMKTHRYWSMPRGEHLKISFKDAAGRLEELLRDSIKLQMKVDVPIGTFLSGGIDSGLVTSWATAHNSERLKSFSVGFKEKSYSELNEAIGMAKHVGVELHATQIERLTPDILQSIFTAFDEPLGNASAIPTYFLAKKARESVTVVLTGDGGDELFGGYPTYQAPYYQACGKMIPRFMLELMKSGINKLPVSHSRISLDYRLKQLMEGIDMPYQRAHYTWRQVTPLSLQKQLFKGDIMRQLGTYDPFSVASGYFDESQEMSRKNQLMYVDMNTYLLNDHLRKVDRMTMANSLEARVPYLDYRIVEFAMRLPEEYKTTFFKTKKILKHIAKDYLTKEVILGKKKGLTSPIADWISIDLKEYVFDMLQGGLMDELFKQEEINQLLSQHHRKEKDNSRILWSLLTLQGWSKNLK